MFAFLGFVLFVGVVGGFVAYDKSPKFKAYVGAKIVALKGKIAALIAKGVK